MFVLNVHVGWLSCFVLCSDCVVSCCIEMCCMFIACVLYCVAMYVSRFVSCCLVLCLFCGWIVLSLYCYCTVLCSYRMCIARLICIALFYVYIFCIEMHVHCIRVGLKVYCV